MLSSEISIFCPCDYQASIMSPFIIKEKLPRSLFVGLVCVSVVGRT